MALDADRRATLERARALALVRSRFDVDVDAAEVTTAPFGVAVRAGDRAWIVSTSDDLAVLGGVLVWVDRHRPATFDLVVDRHAGVHARRAAALAPEGRVWEVRGDDVTAAEPATIPPARPRPDDTAALEAVLVDEGLEVICEDGIVRGELAGLEVARILHGPDGPVLEAGVGRFDREAGVLLHAGRTPAEAVAAAAAQVRPHRTRGASAHAVNRLARERWLRAELLSDPSPVGVTGPEPVEPIPPRRSLLEVVPAVVRGESDGRVVLVACSVGVDLGLVPALADLVAVHEPAEVRVVVPVRDRLPVLERLVTRLPVPASIRTVAPPWRD